MEAYRSLYEQILNVNSDSEASLYADSQSANSLPEKIAYGSYRMMFAKDFSKKIEAKFGRAGSKLPAFDSKVLTCELRVLDFNLRATKIEQTGKPAQRFACFPLGES